MLTRSPQSSIHDAPHGEGPHAVVIGSGFGGLAAAIRLGARGWRVTVLERLDVPGGRASVKHDRGFTYDLGPTIITAPFLLEELWQLAGRKMSDDVTLVPLDPFYRIRFHDGSHFDMSADRDKVRAEIMRLSPQDLDGYERFMAFAEQLYEVGFEQLGDVPFSTFGDMIRVAPQLLKFGSHRSIYSLAARHVRDERLRFVLSFHPLFVGGNPFSVTSLYGLITSLERKWGVHFAMGGTGRIVDGLAGLIAGQGNRIRYGAEVSRILTDKGRATGVELKGGERIDADIVVSNADVAWTYKYLLPASDRRRWTDKKIDRARYSMSLFVWYFGTKRRYETVDHHTILLGPRYRGLINDIFKTKRLSEDFSLYLHRPTATDPSLAPPGCEAFYVLSPVPHLDGDTDWTAAAEDYRLSIMDALEREMLPGLSENIVSSHVMTPLDFESRLLSYKGAAFSFEPLLTQSAWFRPHNESEDVKGLYLVGAGTHPGAGVPGVLSSARVLDRIVPHVSHFA